SASDGTEHPWRRQRAGPLEVEWCNSRRMTWARRALHRSAAQGSGSPFGGADDGYVVAMMAQELGRRLVVKLRLGRRRPGRDHPRVHVLPDLAAERVHDRAHDGADAVPVELPGREQRRAVERDADQRSRGDALVQRLPGDAEEMPHLLGREGLARYGSP